jgi:hypothetical protein
MKCGCCSGGGSKLAAAFKTRYWCGAHAGFGEVAERKLAKLDKLRYIHRGRRQQDVGAWNRRCA